MKFSFIIPAKNEEKLIEACLKSICNSCYFSDITDYEIIVVNNQSTDETRQIALFSSWADIICESEAYSIAGVRNRGTNFATGDYFIFVDADSKINTYLLLEMLKEIKIKNSIGGGCKLNIDKGTWLSNFLCNQWNKLCKKKKWYTGSFIFVERNTLDKIGAFNQNLFLCEDIDFSYRLNQFAKATNQVTSYIESSFIYVSDRKLKLFSIWEHLKFWFDLLFNFNKVIKNRNRCPIWYQIRR